ncbi:hypothetical protein Aperf_G00000041498 [Anoplocephala perfoliata]
MAGDNAQLITELDALFVKGDFQEAYDKLVRSDGNYNNMDLALMWRLAQAARFLVLTKGKHDKKRKLEWIDQGLKVTEAAVEKYPTECLSNTWRGIMLNVKSVEEGIRKRIELCYRIREFFQKGLEANPNDYVTLHCMGSWCYEVASAGRAERLIAKTLFDEIPKSSFEEALEYFLKADKVEPDRAFTVCRIALCYSKMKEKDKAKEWAQKAVKLPVQDSEMEEAQKECQRLL